MESPRATCAPGRSARRTRSGLPLRRSLPGAGAAPRTSRGADPRRPRGRGGCAGPGGRYPPSGQGGGGGGSRGRQVAHPRGAAPQRQRPAAVQLQQQDEEEKQKEEEEQRGAAPAAPHSAPGPAAASSRAPGPAREGVPWAERGTGLPTPGNPQASPAAAGERGQTRLARPRGGWDPAEGPLREGWGAVGLLGPGKGRQTGEETSGSLLPGRRYGAGGAGVFSKTRKKQKLQQKDLPTHRREKSFLERVVLNLADTLIRSTNSRESSELLPWT